MSRRLLFPESARWTLLGLLALGTGARATPSCDSPEELLNVLVGSSARGTVIVRVERNGEQLTGVLLPPEVLRPTEQNYVAERVSCDGVDYLRLQPELRLSYRADSQELRVSAVPARLGTQNIDLSTALRPREYPVTPAFGLDFGAVASATYDVRSATRAPFSVGPAQAYVGVGGSVRTLTGYAGVLYTRRAAGTNEVQLRATAQYALNSGLTLYAGYNAAPTVAQPGFSASGFTGVGAVYRHNVTRVLPRLTLELETPATITIYVNNTRLGTVEAAAGQVNLLNLPLENQSRNTVELLLEDENGVSRRSVTLPAEASALPGGGLLLSALAGRNEGIWRANVSGQYAVNTALNVQAQAQAATDGSFSASVQGRYAPPGAGFSTAGGVVVARPAPAPGVERPPVTTTLNLAADLLRDSYSLGAGVAVPVGNLRATSLNLRGTYTHAPWVVSARLSSELSARTWAAELGLNYVINERSSLALTTSVQPGGWRAQLSGVYTFSPKLQVSGSVVAGPGSVSPGAALSYQPDTTQALTLRASREDVSATYTLARGVDADASVSLRGAAVRVQGAVSMLDGQVQLTSGLTQRGLLIRTGVSGVLLTVEGAGTVTTNARGDALITNVLPGQTVLIRVRSRDLPLGISVAAPDLEVLPAPTGLTLVDWRSNFTVSTFVRFAWAPGEFAADADLYLDGERIPLDDEGYGLVRRSAVARTGELRSQDGTRRCVLRLEPSAETATCAALPPP
ncbi:fimbria/pilus outer membrane usher protein [Deinococcus aquaedulcis]|uniref:hypothetical protein n=1 Tax=Deinococcus aquaedulcis TaxID=2840455 RepID=UPI001C8334E6|nr:hypothetical protein [Deinococcus aquaedulcis]